MDTNNYSEGNSSHHNQDGRTSRIRTTSLRMTGFALLSIFLVAVNLSDTPTSFPNQIQAVSPHTTKTPKQWNLTAVHAHVSTDVQPEPPDNRSETQQPAKPPQSSSTCPQFPCDLSIAFIGDSLTRFMYISLVYYLRHNRWIDPEEHPNLVKPKDFLNGRREGKTNWLPFYAASMEALSPYESCDCWREPGKILSGAAFETVVENRYYHDPLRNNTVVFYQAFGKQIPIRGHWKDPKEILLNITHKFGPWTNGSTTPPFQFTYKHWADAIVEEVVPIRPHTLVMNAGLWKHDFGRSKYVDRVIDAATASISQVIWKTTSADRSGDFQRHLSVDQSLCERLQCMNISGWTSELDTSYYVDTNHFLEPVYRKMNEQLLWDYVYPSHPAMKLQNADERSLAQLPWSTLNLTMHLL